MKKEDKWAEIYDKSYEGYTEDIKFYANECKKVKGPILEVGCGTGRIYLELLKKSLDVYGFDISKAMIERLKEKANNKKLKLKVADMKSFKYPFKFNLIIVPFRTFLLNTSQEDQIKTLKNIYIHLKKGGRLILNFYYPDPALLSQTPDLKKNSGTGTYFSDKPNQITRMIYKESKNTYTFDMAFIGKREFELLLRLSGFKRWKVYGGFDKRKLNEYNQEMVWIVEK